ncbi:MAG: 4-hydroxyphenylpyruvate dioxygenase [Bdellovibrionaceae bacterium]|nr:4-hydroxyphenylpyruvate dioxygenase [Pseudobdellovibrionaceae bacterium]
MELQKNEIGLIGIDFIEFTSEKPEYLEKLFLAFGFSKVARHKSKSIEYFKQNDIHFFLNHETGTFAHQFAKKHGASICSMGWRFENPEKSYQLALSRGARPAGGDYKKMGGATIPAIYGIGDSLIYFVDKNSDKNNFEAFDFTKLEKPILQKDKGFTVIDHLTNNVYNGTMDDWSNFYKNIFGFSEVRYFDIRGAQTGLTSYALKSPCESFCIPINEAKETKSQINEYLEEYNGPGIQHIAFLTNDILSSLKALENSQIETLDIDDTYYSEIFNKFPQVSEDHAEIKKYNVLVDGETPEHGGGYLLQIFTKNIIGPIFIEIIQRKNHFSFGEGNFGALFRSIERDQMKRGYLKPE